MLFLWPVGQPEGLHTSDRSRSWPTLGVRPPVRPPAPWCEGGGRWGNSWPGYMWRESPPAGPVGDYCRLCSVCVWNTYHENKTFICSTYSLPFINITWLHLIFMLNSAHMNETVLSNLLPCLPISHQYFWQSDSTCRYLYCVTDYTAYICSRYSRPFCTNAACVR